MNWVELPPGLLPPENVDMLVAMKRGDSGVLTMLGRNLEGCFCWYDPVADRFVDFWDDASTPGFLHVTHYAIVETP